MENGMDSSTNPSLESEHFIVDSSTEGMMSCFDFESSTTFSNVKLDNSSSIKGNPFVEDDFRNCNKHILVDRREASQLLNGDETSFNDDGDLVQIFQKADSSQEFVNLHNSVNNLEDDISIMSINANTPENLKRTELADVHHFDFSGDSSSLSIDCNAETVQANDTEIMYISYESENQMPDIMKLIQKDLSEPYSIYTYRYFIHNWPHLCFLAVSKGKSVGAIVCKLDLHRKIIKRGYIAMLAVDESYRKKGIGSNLVLKAIRVMATEGADEVVLETEITNQPALRLYENLGFVRDKRLFRYYLNGVDALRLKLWLR